MKTPTLVLSLTVFALTASVALAGGTGAPIQPGKGAPAEESFDDGDAPQGPGFRNTARRAGHRLTHTDRSEPGEDHHVRDSIREGVRKGAYRLTHTDHSEPGEDHHVRDTIRNTVHAIKLHRPRVFHYLEMRKEKNGKVSIFRCEPMIERLANSQECVALTRSSLDAKSLYRCADRNLESKFGRRIARNLDKLMRRDFDIRRIDDSAPDVNGYSAFLQSCQGPSRPVAVAPKAKPAARAVPLPPARPVERPANPEFKPIDPVESAPVAREEEGTL